MKNSTGGLGVGALPVHAPDGHEKFCSSQVFVNFDKIQGWCHFDLSNS